MRAPSRIAEFWIWWYVNLLLGFSKLTTVTANCVLTAPCKIFQFFLISSCFYYLTECCKSVRRYSATVLTVTINGMREYIQWYIQWCILYLSSITNDCGPGSSVGIVTGYGMDGPGSNPGGDEIFRPSRPALGFTEPPVKLVPGLSRG